MWVCGWVGGVGVQLAQLERAHSRLQTELERHKDSSGAKEDLRESRVEVERLTTDLRGLRMAQDTLRLPRAHTSA